LIPAPLSDSTKHVQMLLSYFTCVPLFTRS